MLRSRTLIIALATAALLAGGLVHCERRSTATTASSIAGTYTATTFLLRFGGVDHDVLAGGGGLTLTLTAAGQTVTGTFSPTASNPQNMAGTYTPSGTTVRFQQTVNTFIEQVAWTLIGNTLAYSGPIGAPDSVTIVLTRT